MCTGWFWKYCMWIALQAKRREFGMSIESCVCATFCIQTIICVSCEQCHGHYKLTLSCTFYQCVWVRRPLQMCLIYINLACGASKGASRQIFLWSVSSQNVDCNTWAAIAAIATYEMNYMMIPRQQQRYENHHWAPTWSGGCVGYFQLLLCIVSNAVFLPASPVLQSPLGGRYLLCEARPPILWPPPLIESKEYNSWTICRSEVYLSCTSTVVRRIFSVCFLLSSSS